MTDPMPETLDWSSKARRIESRNIRRGTVIYGIFKDFPAGFDRYTYTGYYNKYHTVYRVYKLFILADVQVNAGLLLRRGDQVDIVLPELTLNNAWKASGCKLSLQAPKDVQMSICFRASKEYVLSQIEEADLARAIDFVSEDKDMNIFPRHPRFSEPKKLPKMKVVDDLGNEVEPEDWE
jgi:hypothetical protein